MSLRTRSRFGVPRIRASVPNQLAIEARQPRLFTPFSQPSAVDYRHSFKDTGAMDQIEIGNKPSFELFMEADNTLHHLVARSQRSPQAMVSPLSSAATIHDSPARDRSSLHAVLLTHPKSNRRPHISSSVGYRGRQLGRLMLMRFLILVLASSIDRSSAPVSRGSLL